VVLSATQEETRGTAGTPQGAGLEEWRLPAAAESPKLLKMRPAGGNALVMSDPNEQLVDGCRFVKLDKIHDAVKSGASMSEPDAWGWTPLHDACSSGNVNTVRILVGTYHADVSLANRVGWTPLHWAAAHGHYEVVRALVSEFGASVRAQTKHGETPLDVAKRLQQKEVAEFLKGVNW